MIDDENLNIIDLINSGRISKLKRFLLQRTNTPISNKTESDMDITFGKEFIKAKKRNQEVFKQIINSFLIIMIRDCKYFNFEMFKKAFSTTRFKIISKKHNYGCGEISYHTDNIGEIEYLNFSISLNGFMSSTHELLHLSSLCGFPYFAQSMGFNNVSQFFGTSINEGTTQFMDKKYFNTPNDYYIEEEYIVRFLDKILGDDILEKSYFSFNPTMLINEINKYMNYEEIYNFIINFDNITKTKKRISCR